MNSEVIVYGKPDCPYCDKAKEILEGKGINFEYLDVVELPELKEYLVGMGLTTVPQIFVDGKYHGESDSASTVGDYKDTFNVKKRDGSLESINLDKSTRYWSGLRKV